MALQPGLLRRERSLQLALPSVAIRNLHPDQRKVHGEADTRHEVIAARVGRPRGSARFSSEETFDTT
jgi:hypothetical protein